MQYGVFILPGIMEKEFLMTDVFVILAQVLHKFTSCITFLTFPASTLSSYIILDYSTSLGHSLNALFFLFNYTKTVVQHFIPVNILLSLRLQFHVHVYITNAAI
jgi:hypothetical protein